MLFRSSERRAAGRYYIMNDGSFTPEQYADMAMTRLFESAKNLPQPYKTQVLEFKAQFFNVLCHYFSEAMADERRRVATIYELGDTKKARLMLPATHAEGVQLGFIKE